ncbi:MAG: proteasome-activating nucleotidase [Candidatus Thermoplasmatota archaeon]|nr:proteasome-activating nucleotidase [Candidatus Thermoplasmatota archaeon]MCL5681161.1 proteasome-activating nucleotidase [Candidatus Thermoplasmatota archaeon]
MDEINDVEEVLRQLRVSEEEKRYTELENKRLQDENEKLKKELNRMKLPPLLIGSVEDIVDERRIVIRSSTGPSFLVYTSEHIPREKLTVGARVALNKATLSVISVIPEAYDPTVVASEISEKPNVTYSDIGGLEEQIKEIREMVELPLLNPEIFKRVGVDPPTGVLLVGNPGTGKTLLAKAVANNTNATFIRVVASELVRKYIGEGARLVRELFDLARKKAPSIIFIDEMDAIGSRRIDSSTSGDREVQRTLMQLLAEIDGFEPLGNIKLVAASNRPDTLDEALMRPGRFDRIIEIPLPDSKGRAQILRIHSKKMNLKDVDLKKVADITEGFSGADLKAVTVEAGMFAIREGNDFVSRKDMTNAVEKIKLQKNRSAKQGNNLEMFV